MRLSSNKLKREFFNEWYSSNCYTCFLTTMPTQGVWKMFSCRRLHAHVTPTLCRSCTFRTVFLSIVFFSSISTVKRNQFLLFGQKVKTTRKSFGGNPPLPDP